MGYRIDFAPAALEDLDDLDSEIVKRVVRKLKWFEAQSNPFRFAEKIRDPSIGDVRFRIGDWRAVGVVDYRRHIIAIVSVGHRRDIYRR